MAHDLEQLAARVQAMEDREAIKSLKYRYFDACDRKQPERMKECFLPGEVLIDYGRVGSYSSREELAEAFTRMACHEHIVEMHHAQNPLIELQGPDRAQGHWGLYYYMINTRDRNITQLGATYDDEYRKVDGQWLISATRCVVHSTLLMGLEEGMSRILFAGRQAAPELDDPGAQA